VVRVKFINKIKNWWKYDVLKKPKPTFKNLIKAGLVIGLSQLIFNEVDKIMQDENKINKTIKKND
jgi:phosphoenolpyruvate carboxylase